MADVQLFWMMEISMKKTSDEAMPSGFARFCRGTKLYDFLLGLPLIAWYGFSFIKLAPIMVSEVKSFTFADPNYIILLDAISKGSTLLFAAILIGFVAIRRVPTAGAPGIMPKIVAFLGAFLGLLIINLPPVPIPWEIQLLSIALIFSGMAFAIYALLWLGDSISVMPQARRLVTTGPYAIVRHPLYLGEETAIVGILLQFLSPLAVLIFILQISFQLWRMKIEEGVLREAFPDYAEYEKQVKRVIPGLY